MEIVLVVMVVFSFAVVGWLAIAQSGEPPAPGRPAPAIRLAGTQGEEQSLPSPGQRVALVFHPQDETPECIALVERLSAAAPRLAAAGVLLATVVVSTREAAVAYGDAHGKELRVLCDPDGRATKAYGALVNLGFLKFARKLFVLVDAHGRVERVWRDAVGPQHVEELLAALDAPAR